MGFSERSKGTPISTRRSSVVHSVVEPGDRRKERAIGSVYLHPGRLGEAVEGREPCWGFSPAVARFGTFRSGTSLLGGLFGVFFL